MNGQESVKVNKTPAKHQNDNDNLIDINLRITKGKATAMLNSLRLGNPSMLAEELGFLILEMSKKGHNGQSITYDE